MRYFYVALAVLSLSIIGLAVFPIVALARHHHHDGSNAKHVHGPTPVEWTYLVYIDGDNNLDPYGDMNIQQMTTVGSQPWLNIVVQQASLSRNDTQRLFITKGKAQLVQDLGGNIQMGDVKTWEDFVQWGVTNYPAQHYFLELWDHGTGWYRAMHRNDRNMKKPSFGDISCNNDFSQCITTTQLGDALSYFQKLIGHKVDIFGTDACLQQMIEIAGEFSDNVNYFVASEQSIPGNGWPYDTFLQQWVSAGPAASPRDIASYITSQYLTAYGTNGEYGATDVTQSFLDLSYIQPVYNSMKALGKHIVALSDKDRQVALSYISQSICFDDPDSCDILSYGNLLAPTLPQLQSTISQLKNDIAKLVVQYGGTGSFSNVTGLAFWLPADVPTWTANNHNIQYETLKFEKQTQWGAALRYMLTGNVTVHMH